MAETIKKLAIVGASVRAAAFSAVRAGFEVVAADLFADADLRAICETTRIESGYPDALADWLATTECDGWLFTGALENHNDLLNVMSKRRPLVGSSSGALRAARNPVLLQDVLKGAGLSFPETVDSAEKLPLDRSWLCKTYRSANGSGVWLLDGHDALERAAADGAYFQRFISGASAAAVFACSREGASLLGVTHQLVGDAMARAKPWHYAGSVGPLRVSDAILQQLATLGDLLSGRFKLCGLVGVDLVIAGDRAWIIEINPRYSSSAEVVERMTGVNMIATHVNACAGEPMEPVPTARPSRGASKADRSSSLVHGKIILFAKREALIDDEFFAWAIAQAAPQQVPCRLADIAAAGELIAPGHPVLTLLASSPAAEYEAEMKRRIGEIESRLYGEA